MLAEFWACSWERQIPCSDSRFTLAHWLFLEGPGKANQTSQTPLFSERKFKGEGHRPSQSYTLWVENLLSMVLGRRQEAEENNSWRVECAPQLENPTLSTSSATFSGTVVCSFLLLRLVLIIRQCQPSHWSWILLIQLRERRPRKPWLLSRHGLMTKKEQEWWGPSEGSDQVPGGQDHSGGQREGSTSEMCASLRCVWSRLGF